VTRPKPLPLRRIFAAPLAVALVTLAGLVAALLGAGPLDAVSWAGLSVPLAAIAWAWWRR